MLEELAVFSTQLKHQEKDLRAMKLAVEVSFFLHCAGDLMHRLSDCKISWKALELMRISSCFLCAVFTLLFCST